MVIRTPMSLPAILVLSLCPAVIWASDDESGEPSQLDAVYQFLKEHIDGKCLETQTTTKIADGTIETEFHLRQMFTSVRRTPEGIVYDEINLIKQKNFDLDENGRRLDQPPHVKSRVGVGRIEVRQSESTGELTGIFDPLVHSGIDPTGTGTLIQMEVRDDTLIVTGRTPLYSDLFAPGDTTRPGGAITTTRFSVEDGELTARRREEVFWIDPETLEWTPSDTVVKTELHEIDGLF